MADEEAQSDDEVAAVTVSQWEFIDRIPTREEVVDLLKTLQPVWGVEYAPFAEFVQGLPSTKKVKGGRNQPDTYLNVVTLYMGVAGRLKMIEAAANLHGWSVDFEPEPTTPTGVPGWLRADDRIVYREYVVIRDERGQLLGRKSGTAWVPAEGGSQAAGSNPYEKVETSARGRAIAAWGFGILPGSGIASLEEMHAIKENKAALQEGRPQPGVPPRKPREELLQEVLAKSEQVRQHRGREEDEQTRSIADYCKRALGLDVLIEGDPPSIDWAKVKDGQLQLLSNQLTDALRKIAAAESPV